MKLGLIGYGRMGKMVEELAIARNHEIVSIIDIDRNEKISDKAECYIDFTIPDSLAQHIPVLCEAKIPLVTGTTGWNDRKTEYTRLFVENENVGIWASNFSLGVNIFWKMLADSMKTIQNFESQYDIFLHEFHHKSKIDAPSGTALTTADIVLKGSNVKKTIQIDTLQRKIKADELHVTSTRGGSVPGTHSVFFDSDFDSIEIKHTARSREGFAQGAILAAENIHKLKCGFFEFTEIFDELLIFEQ
ncbi:MAG: 4-hydroxy-tetrahydrodipicolinate reductase [Paludibacteraceae bacterium]|nr:4-hydroxy-tetrahydrodipicolinate reductase [Paludibacteraceae bacterium]